MRIRIHQPEYRDRNNTVGAEILVRATFLVPGLAANFMDTKLFLGLFHQQAIKRKNRKNFNTVNFKDILILRTSNTAYSLFLTFHFADP
jgi:hypothetical protein